MNGSSSSNSSSLPGFGAKNLAVRRTLRTAWNAVRDASAAARPTTSTKECSLRAAGAAAAAAANSAFK
jgi:hypothetical protein